MAVPNVSHNHNTPEVAAMDSCFVLKHGCPSTWKGQKGIYLKKGKELHLGTELTHPPSPATVGEIPSLEVQNHPVHVSSVASPGCFLFCTLRYLMNVTVRLFRVS